MPKPCPYTFGSQWTDTREGAVENVEVQIRVETEYPFREEVRIAVRVDGPVRFCLRLRIPGWAEGAEVQVDGETRRVAARDFATIDREWTGEDELVLRLPMPMRVERRFNDSASLYTGPLLLALRMGEEWAQVGGELPHADWEVYSSTPWNYALDLTEPILIERGPVPEPPFRPDSQAVVASVAARKIPGWQMEHNAAAPPPRSPVESNEPMERIALIPYGCTNLRVAEFPVLDA